MNGSTVCLRLSIVANVVSRLIVLAVGNRSHSLLPNAIKSSLEPSGCAALKLSSEVEPAFRYRLRRRALRLVKSTLRSDKLATRALNRSSKSMMWSSCSTLSASMARSTNKKLVFFLTGRLCNLCSHAHRLMDRPWYTSAHGTGNGVFVTQRTQWKVSRTSSCTVRDHIPTGHPRPAAGTWPPALFISPSAASTYRSGVSTKVSSLSRRYAGTSRWVLCRAPDVLAFSCGRERQRRQQPGVYLRFSCSRAHCSRLKPGNGKARSALERLTFWPMHRLKLGSTK